MVRKGQIRLMTRRLKFSTKKNNLALLHLTHYGGNSPTYFGMGGNVEHYNLCWGDVVLKRDIQGK